jgi:hypothetical protein
MKHIIITIIAAIALAMPAAAQEQTQQQKIAKHCASIERLARNIMLRRQENVSMSRVMEAVTTAGSNVDARDLAQLIVMQAYDRPSYSTDAMQQREADEFANEWAKLCYQTFRDEK